MSDVDALVPGFGPEDPRALAVGQDELGVGDPPHAEVWATPLAALHRTEALRLRILVPPDPTPTAQAVLEGLHGAELLNSAEVDDATPATDVVHRPYQVSSALDLLTLEPAPRPD